MHFRFRTTLLDYYMLIITEKKHVSGRIHKPTPNTMIEIPRKRADSVLRGQSFSDNRLCSPKIIILLFFAPMFVR